MGPVSVRPSVRPFVRSLTFQKKRLLFQKYLADSNQIWYEASGQWNLSGCASRLDPRPPKGLGGQITSKSGILFKNLLIRNYWAECTGMEMGAFGVYLDVVARHGHWAPIKGVQGVSPYFGIGHKKRPLLPNCPSDFALNLVWGIRVMRFCQIVLSISISPCKATGGQLTPKSGIACKILSYTTKSNALKLIWEFLEND